MSTLPVEEALWVAAGVSYQRRFHADGPDHDTYEHIGPGIGELCDVPPEDFTHRHLREMVQESVLLHPAAPQGTIDVAKDFREGRLHHYHAHLRLLTPRGRTVWVSDCAVVMLDPGTSRPVGSVGILLDITDRIAAERSLARDERVLSQITDAVVTLDVDGRIRRWSTGAERIFGFTATEAVGAEFASLFLEEDRENALAPALAALPTESFRRFEAGNRHRNGEIFQTLVSMVVVRDSDGDPAGSIAYLLDITQQKRNEQLAALGLVTTEMAHSIKNIQTHLIGAMRMVDLGLREDDMEKVHRMWPLMRTSTLRICRVVSDMLGLARHTAVMASDFNFHSLLKSLIDSCEQFAHARGVTLVVQAEPGIHTICQDEGRLFDTLLNLMLNAIEAHDPLTEEDKRVVLHADLTERGRRLELVVEDNGPGIDADLVDRIFHPFFTTKGKHGTGLGLAVARKQVEEMRGEISVDSTQGVGTRFVVTLPLE